MIKKSSKSTYLRSWNQKICGFFWSLFCLKNDCRRKPANILIIKTRIHFKILVITFRALYGHPPTLLICYSPVVRQATEAF